MEFLEIRSIDEAGDILEKLPGLATSKETGKIIDISNPS